MSSQKQIRLQLYSEKQTHTFLMKDWWWTVVIIYATDQNQPGSSVYAKLTERSSFIKKLSMAVMPKCV